jgi:hypothetical protein
MRCVPSSVGAALLGLGMTVACGGPPAAAPPPTAAVPPAAAATLEGTATHGDHNPHHGGVVFMKGSDLHYEVALDATGHAHHVYFSDALREELPASMASEVVLTIRHPAEERIALQIDDTGESWVGSGKPVAEPVNATVRVAFTIAGEPYWIDMPFAAPPAVAR